LGIEEGDEKRWKVRQNKTKLYKIGKLAKLLKRYLNLRNQKPRIEIEKERDENVGICRQKIYIFW
jgi:hypothetical protein